MNTGLPVDILGKVIFLRVKNKNLNLELRVKNVSDMGIE